MKFVTIAAAILIAVGAFAETNLGVAYGQGLPPKGAPFTDHQTTLNVDFWVAGTANGPLLDHFILTDSGNQVNSSTAWTATKINSFAAYYDPFFGKVADVWMDGLMSSELIGRGRATTAHVRVTDSDFPGDTYAYLTVDIYLPNNLSTPIFSRVAFMVNTNHVLIPADAGFQFANPGANSTGLAYGDISLVTNRQDFPQISYFVSYNNLVKLELNSQQGYFKGSRLLSFSCDNNGFLGQNADFWVEGYLSDRVGTIGRSTVAHFIVTHSAALYSFDFAYYAIYIPGHLDAPLVERVGATKQTNHILCR